ncbi:methionyl-tRNA formyltransferase [Rubrivirga sp. SAORIC476]|uniref:methionyl-tRNA formyltransferase n=1 Tax=Rubrivirga sp. SAORIC476 TaxID=1961794 RepID=UPI000BA9A033|nr:methionyl-tRNA formyltransferase [Rubrivirga sp. SAORIC476]PAP80828.1 methionyl-tRNA formyltransferase [Rubrivirga sp. SAORIC476]
MTPPRIVFMGTPDFAVPSLDALVEAGLSPVAVVTVPDTPSGRGQKVRASAVKLAAERHGLPVLQPESVKDPAFAEDLAALAPDILAVVAFRILPPAAFETARLGAFNLHGSLLPAYRGAAPIQRAIMDGVVETGVTTFFLQRTVDTGNVILRRSIPVGPDDTGGDVHDRLMAVGAEAVVETVRRIADGTADAQPQDDALASPAPKLFREDLAIDWGRPAKAVHDHVRALTPYPGAWTTWEGETLKIFGTRLPDEAPEGLGPAGTVAVVDGRLFVACGEGVVEVTRVQRQGKRRMETADFLNGAEVDGAVLG